MNTMPNDLLTPDQAADYLQINRETVYRYIREGKLVASKLGRSYRIPRRSIDLLLLASRTRPDIALREYSNADIAEFLERDELSTEDEAAITRFEANLARAHGG